MSSCCCCIFTGLFRCGRAWKRAKFSLGSRWLITRTVLSHVLAVLWRDFSDVEVRKRVKFSLIKSWLIILSSELVRGMQSCPLVVAVLLLRHMLHAGSSEKATLEATRVGLRYKTDSKRTGQDRGDGVRTCFSIRFAWRTSGFEYSSLRTSRTTGREKGPAVSLLVAGIVCVNWRWGNAGSAVSDTSMSVRPFFFFFSLCECACGSRLHVRCWPWEMRSQIMPRFASVTWPLKRNDIAGGCLTQRWDGKIVHLQPRIICQFLWAVVFLCSQCVMTDRVLYLDTVDWVGVEPSWATCRLLSTRHTVKPCGSRRRILRLRRRNPAKGALHCDGKNPLLYNNNLLRLLIGL